MNGSYDSDLNLIYWGVGNPNPDYYDENTPEKGVAEIIIAKNRAGEPGTVKLAWIAAQTKFAELQFDPGPQNG
jgi:glucose dehydrogenase